MIHAIAGVRLGDVWGSLNYYGRRDVTVSTWSCGVNLSRKINECLDVLEPLDCRFTHVKTTLKPPTFGDVLTCPAIKTKEVWSPNDGKLICYQFDSLEDQRVVDGGPFLEHAASLSYELINVGGHRPLRESVSYLARASWFIGANSGLATVVRSVGTPMIVVTNGLMCHHVCKCVSTLEEVLPCLTKQS